MTGTVMAGTSEHRGTAQECRPSTLGWAARGIGWVPILALVLLFPLTQTGTEVQEFTTTAVCYAIVALSLNVLLGYIGQISLGHQAFVGIGAFTTAYLVTDQGQSFWTGIVAATAIGGAQALILGGISLRIRGLYFALVSLSFGIVAQQNIFQIQELTGGDAGKSAPKPSWFETDWRYYYLCLAFLVVVLSVDTRLMRSRSGRALLAVRENPRVASTFGINVRLATLLAFVVSGAFAGLAGALLAHKDGLVTPGQWDFNLALVFVIMTVVGGLRSRAGAVIGGAFFALLPYFIEELPHHLRKLPGVKALIRNIPDWARNLPFGDDIVEPFGRLTPEIVPFVLGPLLLLATLVQFPGGIAQQLRPSIRWFSGHRFDIHDKGPKEVQISDVRA